MDERTGLFGLMVFKDQMNRSVQLDQKPKRIISLVPSQTELLYDLGLEEEVVAITKFCIHPKKWQQSKTKIGGTKDFKIKQILELKPDLIIANKEENQEEKIKELMAHVPVWISDIQSLEDAINMIDSIGKITDKIVESQEIIHKISSNFQKISPLTTKVKTLYLIWQNPIIAVNQSTFIGNMMDLCGFENVVTKNSDYPTLSNEEIQKLDPELILLSSEPFPFKQKHIDFFKEKNPHASIQLVDGEAFSWYGSRLINSPEYFNTVLKTI
jgi:ABC-type Fe3+-hydroxamate transport system substrate-binding protein